MKNFTLSFVLFILSVTCFAAPPVISGFAPATAEKGTMVIITGSGFTGATAVTFGGTAAASFTVISPTQINAVVAAGTSGQVAVTVAGETGLLAGFTYVSSSRIVTDFGGYWSSTTSAPNGVSPNNSHNLLAFTYGGTLYSTGANDATLNTNGVTYSAGNFRALPVAGISGNTVGGSSTYLALAELVDGVTPGSNVAAVSTYTIKTALTDGIKGLNLGTGVTNLPTTAIMTFPISIIDDTKISDNEPDIILTQIAQPQGGTDVFSFVDASGTVVGHAVSRDMQQLDHYGNYALDLFSLTANTPYNTATPAGTSGGSTETRQIRLVGIRLADFGITPVNVSQITALKVTPGGNSDYAFIAYNANAIFLAPNVTPNEGNVTTEVCSGSAASMSILATPANGGALTYRWEESTDGGNNWQTVTDGGIYSGATTTQLSVSTPTNGYQYRAIVAEAGNADEGTSATFVITVNPPTVGGTVNGSATVNYGTNSTLLTLTGQTGSIVKWQSSTDGFASQITDINNTTSQLTATNITQTTNYRVQVQSGACAAAFSTIGTITVQSLPIRMNSVQVTKESNGLQIQWTAFDQEKTDRFEIERSTDGVNFVTVHNVIPTGSLHSDVTYKWLDTDPQQGNNFYRIKEIYKSGNNDYSDIVRASFESGKAGISVLGNPVTNGMLQLQLNNMPAGTYQVRLINNLGQLVGQMRFSHIGGTRKQSLSLPAKVKDGLYKVEITGHSETRKSFSVLVL